MDSLRATAPDTKLDFEIIHAGPSSQGNGIEMVIKAKDAAVFNDPAFKPALCKYASEHGILRPAIEGFGVTPVPVDQEGNPTMDPSKIDHFRAFVRIHAT